MSESGTFNPVLSTNDLRARSVDNKRFQGHKQKWALGEALPRGRELGGAPRPARVPQRFNAALRRQSGKELAYLESQAKINRKFDILSGQTTAVESDSSADEEVEEASAAPAPDADITYSFDARRGPGQGSQVLSMAVTAAVERFENKMTDKLVKEEYEVLDHDADDEGRTTAQKKPGNDEDDYEFV